MDLLPQARRLVDRIQLDDPMPIICLAQDISDRLENPTSLKPLLKEVRNLGDSPKDSLQLTHLHIVWIEAALRNPNGLTPDAELAKDAQELELWTCEVILPPKGFAKQSLFDPRSHEMASPSSTQRFRLMAAAGLRMIMHLHRLVPQLQKNPDLRVITCLASFTDLNDPWVSAQSYDVAQSQLLLQVQALTPSRVTSLINSILREVIKPVFAKSRSTAITETGRKSIAPLARSIDHSDSEVNAKPWKFRDVYIITVFKWLLSQLDAMTIEENWPFVIPPILALIDDEDTTLKIKGCEALMTLLKVVPSNLLQRTGLYEVFEEALVPGLSYLPTLTPEEESINLLHKVYPTLVELNSVRYSAEAEAAARSRMLHRLVREGVIKGYLHASGHVKVADFLFKTLSHLIDKLGISFIVHLKDIVPIFVDLLRNPFVLSYPPLVVSTLHTLSTVILNCWPRIGVYAGEIFESVVVCWSRIVDANVATEHVETIKHDLANVLALLDAISLDKPEAGETIDSILSEAPSTSDLLFRKKEIIVSPMITAGS